METPQQQFLYYVWVCEVMSQQTQVPRVAEYFAKWIHRWPTVQVNASGHWYACQVHADSAASLPPCQCVAWKGMSSAVKLNAFSVVTD